MKQSFFASLREDKERTIPTANQGDDGATEDGDMEGRYYLHWGFAALCFRPFT